jgi:hypothetical protein
MNSKIQNITPTYTKFENILPDELSYIQITEELEDAKNEINNIIEEDLRNVKSISSSKNKAIPFNEFSKPPSIIKAAFYLENDDSQDPILFQYAHWTMSFSALRSLSQHIIEMSRELKTFYADYINATARHEKAIEFSHFVRAYQDFNGYLISIYNTINQYYDLFVQICNEIDPNNKEQQTLTQFQSDIDYRELLAAIKELLLHGDMGRIVGFPLLRSILEIFITREIFNIRKSSKYNNNEIIFLKKRVPCPKTIIRVIEKLNLERSFKTDSLRRLYDWQSIVTNRDYRIDYLLWFVSERTALEILAAFNANLKHYRDQILEELQNEKEIQIK